jgi:hypothetical protein
MSASSRGQNNISPMRLKAVDCLTMRGDRVPADETKRRLKVPTRTGQETGESARAGERPGVEPVAAVRWDFGGARVAGPVVSAFWSASSSSHWTVANVIRTCDCKMGTYIASFCLSAAHLRPPHPRSREASSKTLRTQLEADNGDDKCSQAKRDLLVDRIVD